jgi:hypothetical protein
MARREASVSKLVFSALLVLAACNGETTDDQMPMFDLPQILAQDSPICLSYEPTTLGETRNYATLLRNDGKQQLVIMSSAITGDERTHFELAGVDPTEVNSFENAHVLLRYKPTAEGWDTALLEVNSNAQNYPSYRIFILALGRPAGAPDTWDPGPKPAEAFNDAGEEACENDYKPRQ